MKKNKILRLGLLALALTLVTGSLVSGTFAKYVTTVTGTGTVTVAHWVANFAGVTGSEVTQETATFNLIGTLNDSGVYDNMFAPGTEGSFALTFDTAGAQVARNVKITLDASAPKADLDYLKFYSDASRADATEITGTDGVYVIHNMNYTADAAGTEEIVNVYWKWAYETTDGDALDTIDGIAGKDYNVSATFVATQLDEYVALP